MAELDLPHVSVSKGWVLNYHALLPFASTMKSENQKKKKKHFLRHCEGKQITKDHFKKLVLMKEWKSGPSEQEHSVVMGTAPSQVVEISLKITSIAFYFLNKKC